MIDLGLGYSSISILTVGCQHKLLSPFKVLSGVDIYQFIHSLTSPVSLSFKECYLSIEAFSAKPIGSLRSYLWLISRRSSSIHSLKFQENQIFAINSWMNPFSLLRAKSLVCVKWSLSISIYVEGMRIIPKSLSYSN